jgi:L-asparaginase
MTVKKKKVHILHTGGTVGMDLDGVPLDSTRYLEVLGRSVPQAFELAEISVEILFSKDSSNMTPADWVVLARALNEQMNQYDAFIVTHGTDTMAFTASALSFMMVHLPKPIVLTGSQRPLADVRSDAPRNLLNAIQIGVEQVAKEVGLFFDATLIRGNRAKKLSIPSFRAFDSPNLPPLATIGVSTDYTVKAPVPAGPYTFDPRIETRIAAITLFPGFDAELFYSLIDKGIKGLVLQAFGPGDIPVGRHSVVNLIRSMTERGIPTVVCSQAVYGTVDLNLYETGRAARDAGAISAHDMTWESAMAKMMVLLGRGLTIEPFRREFLRNMAGELSLP